MSEETAKLLEKHHKENKEMFLELKGLLELQTVEKRIDVIRTGILDVTMKKVLQAIIDHGNIAKQLLHELTKK